MTDVHDPTTRSYRPGDWFGIFGPRATVLLPPSEKGRVAALWELVDDGAGFDETLDALVATGLRGLSGFVLVSAAGDETKVVIRGAARATFSTADGDVEVDGSAAATWAERLLRGVTRMSVRLTDQPEANDEAGPEQLRLAAGLVRLSRVDQPPLSAATPAVEEPADPASAAVGPEDPLEYVGEETQAVPYLLGAHPDEPTVDQPDDETDDETDHAPDDGEVDDVADEYADEEPPIWVPRPPVPPAADAPAADAPEAVDHDGLTRAGTGDPDLWDRSRPGIPGQPPAPPVTARPVARLVLSSGESVDVDRAVLIGRSPEARRFATTEQPRLVTVPSPNQEVSSTHLEIRPGSGADHGSAVVTDVGSTNGTVLVQPGLPPEDLQPGIAVQLIPGAVVDLGDGVTIQVTHP